jgi:hypothetical protein
MVAMSVASVAALALVWIFWTRTWMFKRYVLALVIGLCLFLCIPLFGASTAWWKIGFVYGTERFPTMAAGSLVNNVPGIMQSMFGWYYVHQTVFTLPAGVLFGFPSEPVAVDARQILMGVFLPLFVLGAFAAARQWRRQDRNLLVALTLPWVLFYTLLPQMTSRYAVFAAGVGAICIGSSVGMSLLALVFSALTVMQTSLSMMAGTRVYARSSTNPLFNGGMLNLFETLTPGVSWAVIVAAGVFVWVSLPRARRRMPSLEQAAVPAGTELLRRITPGGRLIAFTSTPAISKSPVRSSRKSAVSSCCITATSPACRRSWPTTGLLAWMRCWRIWVWPVRNSMILRVGSRTSLMVRLTCAWTRRAARRLLCW